MAMVHLRFVRGIGAPLYRVLERNRPEEYPEVESEREGRASKAFGKIAVEGLVVDDVDLVGGAPPGSSRGELRKLLAPQERPDLPLDPPRHNFAVH